jgi:hypothetical protein
MDLATIEQLEQDQKTKLITLEHKQLFRRQDLNTTVEEGFKNAQRSYGLPANGGDGTAADWRVYRASLLQHIAAVIDPMLAAHDRDVNQATQVMAKLSSEKKRLRAEAEPAPLLQVPAVDHDTLDVEALAKKRAQRREAKRDA